MASQKIVWTALPKGIHDGTLKLSLFVAPRLTPGGSPAVLKSFPDFWDPSKGHWPATIASRKFSLEFQLGGTTKTVEAKPIGPKPDPKLWDILFKAGTTVRPFEYRDLGARVIHSYPVRAVMSYVMEIYKTIAENSPTSFPAINLGKDDSGAPQLDELLGPLGPVVLGEQYRRNRWDPNGRLGKEKRKAANADQFSAYGFSSKEEMAFTEVQRFYDRPHPGNTYREAPSSNMNELRKRLAPPKPDFHEMLAALGDYPVLMRMLGLVIDLEVIPPSGETAGVLLGAEAVRMKPASPSDYAPWTRIIKDFVAQPRPESSDIADGMLRLDNKKLYDLIQVDVDAVGLKTLQFAGNILGLGTGGRRVTYTTPQDASLPSVRTSGMAIAKYNRAYALTERFEKSNQMNAALLTNAATYLYADDLVRGYRVDVWDKETDRWHSLCQRIGNYAFPGSDQKPLQIVDEGYIKGASTTSTKDGTAADKDLYLHENMFQWDGWSLCASMPGKTIVSKGYDSNGVPLPHQDEVPEVPQNRAVTEFKMEVDHRVVPGSLPRLRYGRQYRMRARAVDLAGNSVPLDVPSSWKNADPTAIAAPKKEHPSDALIYGRFEPVSSPVLVPLKAFGEGESLEHMVIRSNYDVTAEAYGQQAYVQNALAGKWYTYLGFNERHVAPPKTSQLNAELHGMFEKAIGKGKPHDSAYAVALKEQGTFLDRVAINSATGTRDVLMTGISLVTPPQTPKPHAVLAGQPVGAGQYELKPGSSVAAGQYVVHDTPQLKLPYLPDPIARGVAFRNLPMITSEGAGPGGFEKAKVDAASGEFVLKVPLNGIWPEVPPFRLRIVEGNGEPQWAGPPERALIVPIPKGRMIQVLYSSYIGKDSATGRQDIESMGLTQWVTNPGARLGSYAEKGSHWMLTPFRTLEMVHAVQQPLEEAKFHEGKVKKWKIGDTHVDIFGFVDMDMPSTGKIEVLADWFDPTDPLTADKPDDTPGDPPFNRKSSVFSMEIEYEAPDPLPIHVPEVDKLQFRQADLRNFPGVDLPDVPDGDDAKIPVVSDTDLVAIPKEPIGLTIGKDVTISKQMKESVMMSRVAKGGTMTPNKIGQAKPVSPQYAPHARHEFNDTKHRFVNYQIVATTRYREYFPPAVTHDPKNITRTGPVWDRVNILSSARPDAPKVLYVVPTFGWEMKKIGDQIVSRRCGGGLRVYLDRPWYSSGEGELLGVVMREGGGTLKGAKDAFGSGASGSDPLKPYVTDWGMDPLWGSEYTKPMQSTSDFPIATHAQSGLTLDELPGATVAVAGHPVEYDEKRKLWYCDIEINMGNSYYPFVRLALARYQPDSIADAHLSRIVLADFAQIAPDRVAAVVFDPLDEKKIGVVVSGVTGANNLYGNPGGDVKAYVPGSKSNAADAAKATLGHSLQVAVETRLPGGENAPWVPLSGAQGLVVLAPTQQVDAKMLWTGQITLPEAPRKPGGRAYRLVITETEAFPSDNGIKLPTLASGAPISMRVVYADTILLQ